MTVLSFLQPEGSGSSGSRNFQSDAALQAVAVPVFILKDGTPVHQMDFVSGPCIVEGRLAAQVVKNLSADTTHLSDNLVAAV